MIDQLIIGEKASFDDFGASLTSRRIAQPKKKSIKESVPFSNKTYDFSAINGEVYWEERELEYVFEMIAPNPERLEDMKIAFANWVMAMMEVSIFDPFIPDYHFVATFDDINFADEDNIEKTTVTVKFSAYPYKIANNSKGYAFAIPANTTSTFFVENSSSHKVTPTLTTDQDIRISVDDGQQYDVSTGTIKTSLLSLPVGEVKISIKNLTTNTCSVQMNFFEEVF